MDTNSKTHFSKEFLLKKIQNKESPQSVDSTGHIIVLDGHNLSDSESLPSISRRKNRNFIPTEKKDQRYWKHRSRNNEAARKSRANKRQYSIAMRMKIEELREENNVMKAELRDLKKRFGILLENNADSNDTRTSNTIDSQLDCSTQQPRVNFTPPPLATCTRLVTQAPLACSPSTYLTPGHPTQLYESVPGDINANSTEQNSTKLANSPSDISSDLKIKREPRDNSTSVSETATDIFALAAYYQSSTNSSSLDLDSSTSSSGDTLSTGSQIARYHREFSD